MKKKLLLLLIVILSLGLTGLTVAGNYFYNMSIARNDKDFLKDDPDLETADQDADFDYEQYQIEQATWRENHQAENVYITSKDNLKLRGIFIPGKNPNKTIILAHGYSGTADQMTAYAQYYYNRYGFNVLMPDARGHGESEGDYIGMGWPERLDYLQWIEYIIERNGPTSEIGLHGVSMGGATVMMTSGETLPTQVKFIIEDCGYSDVSELFSYQLKRMFDLPSFPLIPWTSMITKVRAGYSFGEASSVKQIEKAQVPMIFIHGEEDEFVPFEMVYQVYEVATVRKELIIVPGAQHGNAFDVDSASGKNEIKQMIDSYITEYM